jgi:hypothetical protein
MKPFRVFPCQFLAEIGPETIQRFANIPKADNGEGCSFDMLVRVEKDGAVTEVLLYPPTKVGQCLHETMLKDTFSPLPTPAHWVDCLSSWRYASFFVVVYLRLRIERFGLATESLFVVC